MEFIEKARIRVQHWLEHNQHHQEEYQQFAEELQKQGYADAAAQIREMIDLTAKSSDCLQQALDSLNEG